MMDSAEDTNIRGIKAEILHARVSFTWSKWRLPEFR
jgi:hypothetical protein